jgi:SNF2 family DNA or RNA helicase
MKEIVAKQFFTTIHPSNFSDLDNKLEQLNKKIDELDYEYFECHPKKMREIEIENELEPLKKLQKILEEEIKYYRYKYYDDLIGEIFNEISNQKKSLLRHADQRIQLVMDLINKKTGIIDEDCSNCDICNNNEYIINIYFRIVEYKDQFFSF